MKRIGSRVALGSLAFALVLVTATGPNHAFWSTWIYDYHGGMTIKAFKGILDAKKGKQTLRDIIKANVDQDGGDLVKVNHFHFDSETFEASAGRMASRLNAAKFWLSVAEKARAMQEFGEVLHALQDFYSHSNWVENHMPAANPTVAGIAIFAGLVTKNNQGKFSAGPLKANPNFKGAMVGCTFDPQKRPKPFGNDLDKITTGYFPDTDAMGGKCSHAQLNKDATAASITNPLNGEVYTSARGASKVNDIFMHAFAYDPAQRHTKQLIQDFLQAIDQSNGAVRAAKLRKRFLEDNQDMFLVPDATPSMGTEIAGLQAAVDTKVDELVAADAIPMLHLVSFTDSVTDLGVVNGVDDPLTDFTALVDGLTTAPGGTCPDAALSAIEHSLLGAPPGAHVITVTDASPSESAAVAARVADIAREKDVTLHFLVTGDCGDGGAATYRQLATDSGGYFFRADGSSSGAVEAAAAELIDRTDPNLVTVLLVEQPIAANQLQSWTVPVDGELDRIDFVLNELSGGSVGLTILDPFGASVSTTDLGMVKVARVSNPTPGEWTVNVTGDPVQSSEYAASVQGLSGASLVELSHVEPTVQQQAAHHRGPTYFRGAPLLNVPTGVLARFTGTAEATVFELADFANCAVEPPPPSGCGSAGLDLMEGDGGGQFSGIYTPSEPGPLLARMRGIDGGGNPLQRVIRRPFRSSTIRVLPPPEKPLAIPGSPLSLEFEIENGGAAGTFALEAVSVRGFAAAPEVPTLALTAGQTSTLEVTLTVPLGTDPTQDRLMLRVTSTTDSTITNMGAVTIDVAGGNLEFEDATVSVGESGTTALLTVARRGGAAGEVSVAYATGDESAAAGEDYTATSGTLTFAAGELSKSFSIPITADGNAEGTETLAVTLSDFSGGALPGSALGATVTILDDDACVSGWGPFPGDDTGIVPPDADQSRCEQKVAKKVAVLIKKVLKCHKKQVKQLAKGQSFDEDGCEAAAADKFLAVDTIDCSCVDTAAIAATVVSVLDSNNDRIYCDPAGTPIGGDQTGNVPSTPEVRRCQDKIGTEAAKLAKAWAKCHVDFAKCAQPLDEQACEENAIALFVDKVANLAGCDGCEDVLDVVDVLEAILDGDNDLVFCQ